MKNIKWKFDALKTKEGVPSNAVLYGDSCFMITTSPNRLLSNNINTADNVTLLYTDQYKEHRYWGTLEQMKTLAQQIKDNQELFNRFIYLECGYSNANSNWWGTEINFNSL